MQVVLLKSFIGHLRYTPIQIYIWVIRDIHFDIVQELVMFGKYHNNGNFKVF
jgi:hypothetical protein